MSWDEKLFRFFLKKFQRRDADHDAANHVRLEEVAPTLHLLAGALTGEALKISPAEEAGGYGASQIFLPTEIGLFNSREANRKAYLFRLLYTLTTRSLDLTLPAGEISEPQSLALSALVRPQVLEKLNVEFPHAIEILRDLRDDLAASPEGEAAFSPEADDLLFGRLKPRAAELNSTAKATESFSPESLSSGTEKKGKPRERAEVVEMGEKKDDESPLVHVFEKVLTADEYNSGKKNLDGSDELEEHAEALEELNLRHVIRSRERTRSVYKSDVMVDGGAPDLDSDEEAPPESFFYDEWDHSKGSYRRDWCTVSKSTARSDSEAASALPPSSIRPATAKMLRAQLEKMMNERRWRNRQMDGPEPDLDALVERAADLKSQRTPSNRVYLSRRRTHRDLAATVLVDMSLSTDSWVENRHVIQVARESILLLAEILEGIVDQVSVAAFSSNTRRDCRFLELKGFDESWSKLRTRLPALTPTGYTRIGPAIRHATAELSRTGAKKKLLLLISDGKPTDYDRYEGTYGIEDVRQAIKEAQQTGLRIHSLAIDAEAKFYLPRMFGAGGYQILPHPGLLGPALSKIFAQCLL